VEIKAPVGDGVLLFVPGLGFQLAIGIQGTIAEIRARPAIRHLECKSAAKDKQTAGNTRFGYQAMSFKRLNPKR